MKNKIAIAAAMLVFLVFAISDASFIHQPTVITYGQHGGA